VLLADGAELVRSSTPTGAATPQRTELPPAQQQQQQTLSTAPILTVYEYAPVPPKEVITYSKAVQTSDTWSPTPSRRHGADGGSGAGGGGEQTAESDTERSPSRRASRSSKRLSRREREAEKVPRGHIRRDTDADELKALRDPEAYARRNLQVRALSDDEARAVTSSYEFLDFVDRSTKVIERALDEEYDVLADYGVGHVADDDEEGAAKGKSGIREVMQFWDERWSKRRMVTSISFSPKV
jgi:dynein intermediate chain